MEIFFASPQLQRTCSEVQLLTRCWGGERGRAVARRLCELAAAQALSDLKAAPGRYRELPDAERKQLVVNIDDYLELSFEPVLPAVRRRVDGALDWDSVTSVIVLAITDRRNNLGGE